MRKIIARSHLEGAFEHLAEMEKTLTKVLFYFTFLFLTFLGLSNISHGLLSFELPKIKKIQAGLAHVYGPVPLLHIQSPSYNYEKVEYGMGAMGPVDLDRINEITKKDFENLLIKSVPKSLQQRFSLYIPIALGMAEKYQVDPFWAVAVMWTESHFDVYAKSHANAMGLMQVLPATGHYLSLKLKRPVTKLDVLNMIHHPRFNIEMGVFFLKRLLKKFKNYRYATIAYNMGPGGVNRRLRLGLPVGVNHQYLNKVRGHYSSLIKLYSAHVMARPRPFEMTYVVPNRRGTLIERIFSLDDSSLVDLPLLAKSHHLFSTTYL